VYVSQSPSRCRANSFQGFYINLPLGAVSASVLVFFFHPNSLPGARLPLAQKMKHLDLPGLVLFIPGVLMTLLAVQWGGNKFAWKSATIIGLFVGSALMIALFGAWQWHQQDEASIPPRIIGNRTVIFSAIVSFLGLGCVNLVAYYIPIWFQVIKDETPLKSGVRLLPMVLGNVIMSILSGGLGKYPS
jgi:Fungal trichothecene efflux pump (TRI12)